MGIFHLVMSLLALVNFTDHFREISIKICRILKQKFGCFDFVALRFITFWCISVTSVCLSKSPILDQKMLHFQEKSTTTFKKAPWKPLLWRYLTYKWSGFSENRRVHATWPGSCDWLIFGGRFWKHRHKNCRDDEISSAGQYNQFSISFGEYNWQYACKLPIQIFCPSPNQLYFCSAVIHAWQ